MIDCRVLVIVVTYNSMEWIDRCLTSLRRSTLDIDVMVVDNLSSDGSPRYVEEKYPECILIRNTENKGFGAANNVGLKYAVEKGYDYVYLLNQDAWVRPDTIEVLIEENRANPVFGIISPMQLQANEKHLDNNFGVLISNWKENREYLEREITEYDRTLFELPFVMAAHWLISRDCLMAVGGFSPSFYHYGEDDNYCHRAKFHGYKVGFSTRAHAMHDRETRVQDKKRLLFFDYIMKLKAISNPNATSCFSRWYLIKDAIVSVRINKTLLPVKYLFRLLKEYGTLLSNREISKKGYSFLD